MSYQVLHGLIHLHRPGPGRGGLLLLLVLLANSTTTTTTTTTTAAAATTTTAAATNTTSTSTIINTDITTTTTASQPVYLWATPAAGHGYPARACYRNRGNPRRPGLHSRSTRRPVPGNTNKKHTCTEEPRKEADDRGREGCTHFFFPW